MGFQDLGFGVWGLGIQDFRDLGLRYLEMQGFRI